MAPFQERESADEAALEEQGRQAEPGGATGDDHGGHNTERGPEGVARDQISHGEAARTIVPTLRPA